MTGEQNLRLIREIEANREFLLTVLGQNSTLLARAEPRIQQLLEPLPIAGTDAPRGKEKLSHS